MRRLVPLLTTALIAGALSLPAGSVRAEDPIVLAGTSARTTVADLARVPTTVSGWAGIPSSAASTVPLRMSVRIRTGDRFVQRIVSLQRRAAGKKRWKTVRTAATSAAGQYTALLSASAGRWQFRLKVKAGAGAGAARTAAHKVVVTRLMVAVGEAHSCALRVGGTVRCWGSNTHGQLGDGTRTDRVRPVAVKGVTGATAIAAGSEHTCALLATGRVTCWGRNAYRQLGVSGTRDRLTAVKVKGVRGGRTISAGDTHACVVVAKGRVTCWGAWGYIDEEEPDFEAKAPKRVPGLKGVTALAGSEGFDCALGARGRVWCWGQNGQGELGDGTTRDRAKPVRVRNLGKASAIATGETHACAVVSGGRMACWGTNLHQGLGRQTGNGINGEGKPALSPVLIRGLTAQTAVTAGVSHTCGVGRDGRVRCVGSDVSGQLGDAMAYLSATLPVQARGVRGAIGVAAGLFHSCAQLAAGPVLCWGSNYDGQLGDGSRSTEASSVPIPVRGITHATAISAGPASTCVTGRTVSCWGTSDPGDLAYVSRPTPQAVAGLAGVVVAAAGTERTCAVLAGGAVTCWTPARPDKRSPVLGLAGAVTIGGGWDYHCALLSDGTVQCWDKTLRPRRVAGISGATAISLMMAAGWGQRGCAVVTGGKVSCWTDPARPATPVDGIAEAIAVSRTGSDVCILLTVGTVTCRSDVDALDEGPLGPPRIMSGITDAVAIGAGGDHTCALLARGTIRCWGFNPFGQLGNGATWNADDPVTVKGITTASAIALGMDHTCAVLAAGAVRCWGANTLAQLGRDEGWSPRRVLGLG